MKAFILFMLCFSSFAITLKVGSKPFTENSLLAEIVSQIIETEPNYRVERKFGLAANRAITLALQNGEIDLYPEYSGTLAQIFLKMPKLREVLDIRNKLKPLGITISDSIGFNNTYAFAVRKDIKKKLNITKISDLINHANTIQTGFDFGFIDREDGLHALEDFYQFKFKQVNKMEHSLLYTSIQSKKIDLMDVYSTDAKILKYDLFLLKDDKDFFPKYYSVICARKDFPTRHPKIWQKLKNKLVGKITENLMTTLNSQVEIEKNSISATARSYLTNSKIIKDDIGVFDKIKKPFLDHLILVLIPLILAAFIGIPLGILANKRPALKTLILSLISILQTIPSLALFCFLIPFMGIGFYPTIVALFLYSLLPITKNTFIGFENIDPNILEMENVLRMSAWQKIKWIELPLTLPYIIAGVKTALIIGIGTATIAAFIGAGGLGELIVQGLYLDEPKTLLMGAIPASAMAIIVQWAFIPLERWAKVND